MALKPYITLGSWVDTTTSCVGKFEWVRTGGTVPTRLDLSAIVDGSPIHPNVQIDSNVECQILIDRDKSWVADEPTSDPLNQRGSLRGCYVSIMNAHGAGQLRRIATNGTDWIAIRAESGADERMTVEPGPISSYMIIAAEDALFDPVPNTSPVVYVPRMNPDGTLVDNPYIDYANRPLCIHRSPVNINTASDKVLAAVLMGIDVQHGHYLSIGTDADFQDYDDRTKASAWYKDDPHGIEPYLLTLNGLKRIPANTGRLTSNRPVPTPPAGSGYQMDYLNTSATAGLVNEAVELAQRIMVARAKDASWLYYDAATNSVYAAATPGAYERHPFTSWDDVYFRVVKPWDDKRREDSKDGSGNYHKRLVAKLLMANMNPNSDILKFNPNIEWIDRWGRNFVDMEPVMIYTDQAEPHNSNPTVADPVTSASLPIYSTADGYLKSSQKDAANNFIQGAYLARSFRYRSDDLIDKTDLNRSTTEFAFNSNGIFEITSTGQVVHPSTGQLLAERKIEAAIKVYDVWTESTQRQFVNGKISKACGNRGTTCSGQVSRDAYNQHDRLALTTLPEPLVPLQYKIAREGSATNANSELVTDTISGFSSNMLDAYGNPRTNPTDATVASALVPDVVANRVLPAQWDGQIVLATNTSGYDPGTGDVNDKDTFLASFDGDLDTAYCEGNGREQAKTPHRTDGHGDRVRVVDTFGLLGLLNDTSQDIDPGLPMVDPADPVNGYRWVYRFVGMNAALKPLNTSYYWNNITMRMGDLRADGIYLSSPGVSGNDATLKYLFGQGDGATGTKKENFDPQSEDGNCVTLWFKSTWHQDDFRTHEFFNASNPGEGLHMARGCYLRKYGQYIFSFQDFNQWAGHSANRTKTNVLAAFWEQDSTGDTGLDWDMGGFLHGGYDNVPKTLPHKESTSFRIQPFRWQFTGMRNNSRIDSLPSVPQGDGQRGHWISSSDHSDPKNVDTVTFHVRPLIDSQIFPEGEKTWSDSQFFCFRTTDSIVPTRCVIGDAGALDGAGRTGQDASWEWADGGRKAAKVFSINNLNFGNMNKVTNPDQVCRIYRDMPEDGTYAVIDELKISNKDRILVGYEKPNGVDGFILCANENQSFDLPGTCDVAYGAAGSYAYKFGVKGTITFNNATFGDPIWGTVKHGYYRPTKWEGDWDHDRVVREQTLSRYYLPPSPEDMNKLPTDGGPPTFTSQTLMQSRRGFDKTGSNETVALVRVAWTVFTPRFMHEYKEASDTRFKRTEYITYDQVNQNAVTVPFRGPFDYDAYNNSSYVDDTTSDGSGRIWSNISVARPTPAKYGGQAHATKGVRVQLLRDPDGIVDSGDETVLATFTDPDDYLHNNVGTMGTATMIPPNQLRYRIQFLYPVDSLVDPGVTVVDPSIHYLLDTPVFDDISITYLSRTRILSFRSAWE